MSVCSTELCDILTSHSKSQVKGHNLCMANKTVNDITQLKYYCHINQWQECKISFLYRLSQWHMLEENGGCNMGNLVE